MYLIYGKIQNVLYVLYSVTSISGDTPKFLEMMKLISFVGTLTQTRMGGGRLTFPSKGPMIVHYVFLMAKSKSFVFFFFIIIIFFFFSIIISRDSANYVIKIFMLISLECSLAQTRMAFGRVTLVKQFILYFWSFENSMNILKKIRNK